MQCQPNQYTKTFLRTSNLGTCSESEQKYQIDHLFTTFNDVKELNYFIAQSCDSLSGRNICHIFYLISTQLSEEDRYGIKIRQDVFFRMISNAIDDCSLYGLLKQLAEQQSIDNFFHKFGRYLSPAADAYSESRQKVHTAALQAMEGDDDILR